MNIIVSWIKNNPIRTMFLIPIVLVAVISISHVVTWYSLANPINWAIYFLKSLLFPPSRCQKILVNFSFSLLSVATFDVPKANPLFIS